MGEPRALVRNTADPKQVKRAARQVDERDRLYLLALAQCLQHPEARYVFNELLERAGLYRSVFDHSGSVMNFKEGARNFGLELRADLERADELQVELMDRERRDRQRRDDRATDAHHTARAEEAAES
jgi:hypothetical protein